MSISKEEFRKKCKEKLGKKAPNEYYLNAKLNLRLQKVLKTLEPFRTVLVYVPLDIEADIRKTVNKLRKKHTVLIPFMEGKSFKMVSYRLPLKKKKFGIYEAGNSYRKFKNLDIAIVPVVGVDKNLQRIGFGKGMYDRFFATLKKRPYTIFVQKRPCIVNDAVCDRHDIKGDLLLTPKGWLEKRR